MEIIVEFQHNSQRRREQVRHHIRESPADTYIVTNILKSKKIIEKSHRDVERRRRHLEGMLLEDESELLDVASVVIHPFLSE